MSEQLQLPLPGGRGRVMPAKYHNLVRDVLLACRLWRGMIPYRPSARADLKALQWDLLKIRNTRRLGTSPSTFHRTLTSGGN